jgi:hypothetical protein
VRASTQTHIIAGGLRPPDAVTHNRRLPALDFILGLLPGAGDGCPAGQLEGRKHGGKLMPREQMSGVHDADGVVGGDTGFDRSQLTHDLVADNGK